MSVYKILDSTLDSIVGYKYNFVEIPKVGDTIELKQITTEESKFFDVEYVKKVKGGYLLKNSNNTIVLKKQ